MCSNPVRSSACGSLKRRCALSASRCGFLILNLRCGSPWADPRPRHPHHHSKRHHHGNQTTRPGIQSIRPQRRGRPLRPCLCQPRRRRATRCGARRCGRCIWASIGKNRKASPAKAFVAHGSGGNRRDGQQKALALFTVPPPAFASAFADPTDPLHQNLLHNNCSSIYTHVLNRGRHEIVRSLPHRISL
jgi:hypothetical protein